MMETPGEIGNGRQEGTSGAVARLRKALMELSTISRKYTQSSWKRGFSGVPQGDLRKPQRNPEGATLYFLANK